MLSINTAVTGKDVNVPVSSGMFLDENGKGSDWLPLRFTLGVDAKHVQVLEGGQSPTSALALSADYELTAVVSQVQSGGEVAHLVSHIKGTGRFPTYFIFESLMTHTLLTLSDDLFVDFEF